MFSIDLANWLYGQPAAAMLKDMSVSILEECSFLVLLHPTLGRPIHLPKQFACHSLA